MQIQSTTARGYTDHEHLDNLGIIHMNGRVYDPALGRFLSPDPIVQAPYDTQAQNRYCVRPQQPAAVHRSVRVLLQRAPGGRHERGVLLPPDRRKHNGADVEVADDGLRRVGEFRWRRGGAVRLRSRGVGVRRRTWHSQVAPRQSKCRSTPRPHLLFGPPTEEVVVMAPRIPLPVFPSIDATLYAPPASIDHVLAAASIGLALVEPSPIGEVVVAEQIAASSGRALSTIRYTRPGEKFIRYESNNRAFSRVTTRGGVRPSTYAAPRADGLVPLESRVNVYNLQDPAILNRGLLSKSSAGYIDNRSPTGDGRYGQRSVVSMGISLMLVLSDRWAEVLTSQPETGMGYQIVWIRLKDGRRIDNVTVVGGIISRLPATVCGVVLGRRDRGHRGDTWHRGLMGIQASHEQ